MTTIKAITEGFWATAAMWSPAQVPGPGDDVYANGYTVYIDQDVDVKSLNTISGSGISAGGLFRCYAARTITITDGLNAAVSNGDNGSYMLALHHTSGTTTINGDVTGGGSSSRVALQLVAGGGAVTVNGNVIGGTHSGSFAVASNSSLTKTLTINGDVTGATSRAIDLHGTWTVTVNGVVTAGTQPALDCADVTALTVVGQIVPGGSQQALSFSGGTTLLATSGSAGGFPDEGDVLDGVVFGPASEFEGTYVPSGYPDEGDVLDGVVFGPASEFTGTLTVGPTIPSGATIVDANTDDPVEGFDPRTIHLYESAREARTTVQQALFGPAYIATLSDLGPRSGVLQCVFDTSAEAAIAEAFMNRKTTFGLNTGRSELDMLFVVAGGELTLTLDPGSVKAWIVSIPFMEVSE